MAGNVKDQVVRKAVRKLLLARENRDCSDREVAKLAECHRSIVREVRSLLVAEGRLPKPKHYVAGASARGGYVFNERGRQVRETTWFVEEATKLSLRTGKMIGQLLRTLKDRAKHERDRA